MEWPSCLPMTGTDTIPKFSLFVSLAEWFVPTGQLRPKYTLTLVRCLFSTRAPDLTPSPTNTSVQNNLSLMPLQRICRSQGKNFTDQPTVRSYLLLILHPYAWFLLALFISSCKKKKSFCLRGAKLQNTWRLQKPRGVPSKNYLSIGNLQRLMAYIWKVIFELQWSHVVINLN